jgi:hypothetical protein
MELSRAQIELRPRQGWEATDLGIIMLRAWWRPLYTVSFLVVFATAAITFAGLSAFAWDETTVIYATCAVLWWLKPLYGRYLLAFPGWYGN